jgi:ferredoxin-NADP reductase
MADVQLTLEATREETPTIRSFRFRPAEPFKWRPGQYLMIKLDVKDPRGVFRSFSIASAPSEGHVLVATRVVGRSPFKRALEALPPNATLNVKAPLGKFVLQEDRRAVFVVGGIGITPIRSMVRHATDARLPIDLLLLYAARSEAELAFREDLEQMARENPRLRVVPTLTRPDDGWTGARGRIDGTFVRREAGSLDDAVVYVCGRPEFVSALRTEIMALGVPLPRVLSEQFPGYAGPPPGNG